MADYKRRIRVRAGHIYPMLNDYRRNSMTSKLWELRTLM